MLADAMGEYLIDAAALLLSFLAGFQCRALRGRRRRRSF
jgi:hypothetical protein